MILVVFSARDYSEKICNLKNNSKFLISGFKAREVYELKYALKCLSRVFPKQSLK